jgi:hypothetical protein
MQPHFDLGPETPQGPRTLAGRKPWPDICGEQARGIVGTDGICDQTRQQETFGARRCKPKTRVTEQIGKPGGEFASLILGEGEPARRGHPHVIERDVFVDAPDPSLGTVRMHNITPRLTGTPGSIRTPAPELGEHTADLFAELGFDEADLAELRAKHVIR